MPDATAKPQRVISCVLCQQRKVKCERKFPCTNCTRAGVQCVPAVALGPHQRRRRFPERELLDRLRQYEELLQENNITFDPLHPPGSDQSSAPRRVKAQEKLADTTSKTEGSEQEADRSVDAKSTRKSGPINIWRAISAKNLDPDRNDDLVGPDGLPDDSDSSLDNEDVHVAVIRNAWDRAFADRSTDPLFFGSPETNVSLTSLHPPQAQIFRLWQVYLENVDPLLKVTHTPTLQTRIINAACDISSMNPSFEALLFGIYCMAVLSLNDEGCHDMFGSSKADIMATYQFGCRQALQNANILRSSDRDCLTAMHFYLISVRPDTDPRSLSSMLGMAIRIAKRLGIHNKSSYTKCSPLEAEMCRRLWWSLVTFDNRICEMFDYQNSTLIPTWDCELPANVNDAELWADMKSPPAAHQRPTEANFAVLRAAQSEFIRQSGFHLDFIDQALKNLIKKDNLGAIAERDRLVIFGRDVEDNHLAFCDENNPLQFMTIWTIRGNMAKSRLLEYYATHTISSPGRQTDADRDAAMEDAIGMLRADAKLMGSSLVARYRWLSEFHFPFPAYMHILQELKVQPEMEHAERAWEAMSDNYKPRMMNYKEQKHRGSPLRLVFTRMVLQAWKAREAIFQQQGRPLVPPLIVSDTREGVMAKMFNAQKDKVPLPDETVNDASNIKIQNLSITPVNVPMEPEPSFDAGGVDLANSMAWSYPPFSGQNMVDINMNDFDWTTIDWNSLQPSNM